MTTSPLTPEERARRRAERHERYLATRWTVQDSADLDAEIRRHRARAAKEPSKRADPEMVKARKAILAYPLKNLTRQAPEIRRNPDWSR